MKISLPDFKLHVGTSGLHKAGLHAITRVHGITTKFYCNKLTLRSACSENCAQCILQLKERLDRTDWATSKKPYALYTFVVKDVSGKVVETVCVDQKAAPSKTIFNEQVETDVLDLFMETL